MLGQKNKQVKREEEQWADSLWRKFIPSVHGQGFQGHLQNWGNYPIPVTVPPPPTEMEHTFQISGLSQTTGAIPKNPRIEDRCSSPTPICSHRSFRLQKTGHKYPALSTAAVGWGTNLPQHGGEKVTVLFWSQQRQTALVRTQKETAGQPSERQRCHLKVRRDSSRLPPTAQSLSELTDAIQTAQRWLQNKTRQKEVQAYYKKAKTTSRKN